MLRADFYPKDFADTVNCDIQFGHIERSTKTETSVEKAQFEICAHKWVDVCENGYGIALLNDCKYGHRVKNGKISLNLLRSTVYPDPEADRGVHEFSFAVYPHKGGVKDPCLNKYAYILNRPLTVLLTPAEIVGVRTDDPAVIVDSIHSEPDGSIAVRLYESSGERRTFNLLSDYGEKERFKADLLASSPTKIENDRLTIRPFEIMTIMLK